eukprot:CAMPEP_0183316454 /NCGR_PEP_ID=MMETSP0160_2-20130417/55014_1 /TAXON_ID=2839 ORGANISM="Odontella Sinensis, Strain Grunow 1884" /NCGR_SAMPLE_ID=MMETSP0160_2 /ASSEMBLY_ACC=CAM_ASM_000250 /LENGTH=50 /DNA_ID=CAMNT_0025482253 /DNA_START=190 /DNA_END=342 /DNA_ORIENTATION=-
MSIAPTSDPIAAQRDAFPANVNPITTALAIRLKDTFSMMVRTTRLPISML